MTAGDGGAMTSWRGRTGGWSYGHDRAYYNVVMKCESMSKEARFEQGVGNWGKW